MHVITFDFASPMASGLGSLRVNMKLKADQRMSVRPRICE